MDNNVTYGIIIGVLALIIIVLLIAFFVRKSRQQCKAPEEGKGTASKLAYVINPELSEQEKALFAIMGKPHQEQTLALQEEARKAREKAGVTVA